MFDTPSSHDWSTGKLGRTGSLHKLFVPYPPYEIVNCSKLRTSRFSTRTLYPNAKNTFALPPLEPWWRWDPFIIQSPAVTPKLVTNMFSVIPAAASIAPTNMLPQSLIEQHILSFLNWEVNSICGAKYLPEHGYYAWSHRRIATDMQALLAFCFSKRCAQQVTEQKCFVAKSSSNDVVTEDIKAAVCPFSHEEAVQAWCKRNKCTRNVYDTWVREHLQSSRVPPKLQHIFYAKQTPSEEKRMRVVQSGDIRDHPVCNSEPRGRDHKGTIVTVLCIRLDDKGREWAQLPPSETRQRWTATTKKDGTVKLIEITNETEEK